MTVLLLLQVAAPQQEGGLLVLTPERVIELALQRSLSVRAAAHGLKRAEAKVEQAKALKRPKFSISDTRTVLRPMVALALPTFDPVTGQFMGMREVEVTKRYSYQTQFSLSYPVYTWGRLRANLEREEKAKEAAYHSLRQARLEATHKAREAFFGLLKAMRFEEVARKSVEQVKAHLDVAQRMFREGLTARYDVLRAESALAQAEEGLTKAENAIEVAKAALLALLDLPQDTPLQVRYDDGRAIEIAHNLPPLSECIRRAKERRSELSQLRAMLDSLRAALRAARTEDKPTVALATTYSRKTATAFAKRWDWALVLSISWPVFDGGLTKAQVEEAKEGIRQLEAGLKEAENKVELDVRQAYLSVREALKRLDKSRRALEAAEESFRLAGLRFCEGLGTTLEVLDAEAALTNARAVEAEALYDLEISLSDLARAMEEIEFPSLSVKGEDEVEKKGMSGEVQAGSHGHAFGHSGDAPL